MYRVYYCGGYCAMFDNRDAALAYIEQQSKFYGDNFEDYEILDGSDE